MKYKTALCLWFINQLANASECAVRDGYWQWMPSNNIMHINVPVKATPGTQRILLDGYTLKCRFSPDESLPGSAKDFWHTASNGLTAGPRLNGYSVGLNINGSDYNAPVGSGTHIATMQNSNRTGVDLKTYMYVINKGAPGNPINIRAGDNLGVIHMAQTNNTGKPPVPHVYIYLNAANDLIVKPSTCTINGNRPLEVNFGKVDQTAIGQNPSTTPIKKTLRLNYSCPDPYVSTDITIGLQGQPSSFNSGVLRMSNPNLGTGLIRAGVLVPPGGKFNSRIYNSSGFDDVTFGLIRRTGTLPATGPFSGSATLVMGVP